MTGNLSPARRLLLLLQEESGLAFLPASEVMDDLVALGVDPGDLTARIRKRAAASNAQAQAAPAAPAATLEPTPASEPDVLRYSAAPPDGELAPDVRIRAGGSPDRADRGSRGRSAVAVAGVLAALSASAVVAVTLWPDEIVDLLSPPSAPQASRPDPATSYSPAEAAPEAEVSVTRLEPVPPPAPPEVAVAPRRRDPEPTPAPPATTPQRVEPVQQLAENPDPNAPINIVPKVDPAPVVEEARLPGNVDRPFTAPPSIVAMVPVEREVLAEAGTGILSRSGRRTADERRLAARVEDAERISAGRPVAALVTVRSAEESYDAVILKRPRVEEDRTIADAEPVLIPLLGDIAHQFDLIRLPAPQ